MSKIHRFSEEVNEELIIDTIEKMNENNMIHGILVQLPLPEHWDTNKVLNSIHPTKDVDGLGTMNAGKLFQNQDPLFFSCTPRGCIELMDEYNIRLRGRNVTIIGSSNLVGLPLSMMLLNRGATVTICNINTRDIREHIQHADILITCCGVPHIVKEDWVNEGTVVIDIGINKVEDLSKKNGYRLVGDVDFENVKDKASYITPVPGGVGPMTIAILMKQIVESCEASQVNSKI
jgi:methylenetetrahydrofolate dehydrogenase (NADP+)/methenyltetrahydrofolate cyclohydrolase/formyltetrahydrofolate synthetase